MKNILESQIEVTYIQNTEGREDWFRDNVSFKSKNALDTAGKKTKEYFLTVLIDPKNSDLEWI